MLVYSTLVACGNMNGSNGNTDTGVVVDPNKAVTSNCRVVKDGQEMICQGPNGGMYMKNTGDLEMINKCKLFLNKYILNKYNIIKIYKTPTCIRHVLEINTI